MRVSAPQVYLLRCGDGTLYCGWTTDLDRRLAAHRAGRGSRYTRARLPVELAGSWPVQTPAAARREEARIKALPRRSKLALLGAAPAPVPGAGARDETASAPVSDRPRNLGHGAAARSNRAGA